MVTQVVDLLGGAQVLGESLDSNLDLVRATREGLPAQAAVRLAQLISVSPNQTGGFDTADFGAGIGKVTAGARETEALLDRIEYGVYS